MKLPEAAGLALAFIARLITGAQGHWHGVAPKAEQRIYFANHQSHFDWVLIWAALPPKPDAQAALVRQRANAAGGHATLLRAPEEVRRQVDVFHPAAEGVAALGERVRQSFDPKGILNRGRMRHGT